MFKATHLVGFGARRSLYKPASYVFNGTDEVMVRTLSTSAPSTTIFTYSFWLKPISFDPDNTLPFQQVIDNPAGASQFVFMTILSSGDIIDLGQDAGSQDWGEQAQSLTPNISVGAWEHWVIRYDSTQATAADRIRMYRNGTLVTTTGVGPGVPALNEQHRLFTSGWQHQIGAQADISAFANVKLAFIDVLEGVSQDATAFAFNNSGTWTRQRYTGSYGTYGFKLDGTNSFNDVSGNGQNFTGTNMTIGTNLDAADLPPYTN